MQRQLKFRVWDQRFKQFITGKNYEKDEIVFAWTPLGILSPSDYANDIIIQQFTGLLDKNKKEIYEGDIIKYIYGLNDTRIASIEWGSYNDGEYVSRIDTYVVKTTQEWPLSDLIYGAEYNYGYAAQVKKDSVEVIGNVFENPELLKS